LSIRFNTLLNIYALFSSEIIYETIFPVNPLDWCNSKILGLPNQPRDTRYYTNKTKSYYTATNNAKSPNSCRRKLLNVVGWRY